MVVLLVENTSVIQCYSWLSFVNQGLVRDGVETFRSLLVADKAKIRQTVIAMGWGCSLRFIGYLEWVSSLYILLSFKVEKIG